MEDDEVEGDFLQESSFFPPAVFKMSWEEFRRLPRHPACRYEYRRDELTITGRPRQLNCRLRLDTYSGTPAPTKDGPDLSEQPLTGASSQQTLIDLFERSFSQTFPYRHLNTEKRRLASVAQIDKVFHVSNSPVNEDASRILFNTVNKTAVAAVIVTQVPDANWSDFTDPTWQSRPPQNAIQQRWGVPHLTWIMVPPRSQRRGLGSLLLHHACEAVRKQGHSHLFSSFEVGNHVSMLWHWKQGFQLLPIRSKPSDQ